MKIIVVLLGVLATCWADSCDNSFGSFLSELKNQLTSSDSAAKDLEAETRDDYVKLVHKCFDNGQGDSSKCSLPDDQLKTDVYGDNGPLQGCSRCQSMVKSFRDKFLHSSETVRKCFRQHLATGIREELEPCIDGKLGDPNFKVPAIPDFDEKTFQNIDVVETTIGYHIMARSRMDVCSKANSGGYQFTSQCMTNGFPGIYAKHCQAAQAAKSKAVQSSCNGRFQTVKQAACSCMEDKRNDWHTKFDKIRDIVNEATSASQCSSDINNVVGSWLIKLQNAINECLPKTGDAKQTDLRTLIELGCGQVINGGVKKNELTAGFRFVRLFLDALNDRITQFCDKNCDY